MTPATRARVVDAMVALLPKVNPDWCVAKCRYTATENTITIHGTQRCRDLALCRIALAERLLAVIERERGEAL